MQRQALPDGGAPAPRPQPQGTAPSSWRRARGYVIQTVLVTLLLGLLSEAGGQLVMPPGLFDRAIQALEASTAALARYDLGAGHRVALPGPGFMALEQAVARAWRAAGLQGATPRVQAGEEAGFISLTWIGQGMAEGWKVTALRENGAPAAFVWLRATGVSWEGLQRQAGRLQQAARVLAAPGPGHLYVRLEGAYGEPLGGAARQAVVASLIQLMDGDRSLTARFDPGSGGARLVIETPGPSLEHLPVPSYAHAR